ncbi:KH domain-containing protein [Candidatus Gottesmanbacteria bacterium]|nr:KH domain-containing protein [Candidatus Gottesmanbacteria bacterium]
MNELLKFVIKAIVDHPDDIHVEERMVSENMYNYTITTNPEDMGKVIGKEGKIIQAIRNLAKILAIKHGHQVRVELSQNPL